MTSPLTSRGLTSAPHRKLDWPSEQELCSDLHDAWVLAADQLFGPASVDEPLERHQPVVAENAKLCTTSKIARSLTEGGIEGIRRRKPQQGDAQDCTYTPLPANPSFFCFLDLSCYRLQAECWARNDHRERLSTGDFRDSSFDNPCRGKYIFSGRNSSPKVFAGRETRRCRSEPHGHG
jgi:hypothetical protein